MGQAELVDQPLERLRPLDRIQVLALEVLDQGPLRCGLVIDVTHKSGDLPQSRQPCSAPAPLADDELVVSVRRPRDLPSHDRLHHAVGGDRSGQRLQTHLVEVLARLARVR